MSDLKQNLLTPGQKIHEEMTYSTTREVDMEFAAEMVRRAKRLIEENRHKDAELYLRQALERVPDHRECQAYIAVCLAGKRKFVSAEKLAKNVIRNNPFDAIAYYALGRVNLLGSRRGSAFRNLEKARHLATGDREMEGEVSRLDPRRPPVIRWLSRNHILNIWFGKWRAAMERGNQN
ncbi:MAG: tetratricopeptide repeat protein [Candidatus Krumholzibacteriota bacterium]